MYEFLLNDAQLGLLEEVRDLVRWVPRQMVLDMDADVIKFPRDFLREAGRRNLMGCRYPVRCWIKTVFQANKDEQDFGLPVTTATVKDRRCCNNLISCADGSWT